jgi:hypothetical protein
MRQDHSVTQAERPLAARANGTNENWLRVLETYQVRFLVLNLDSEREMVELFRSQPEWVVDFEDGESIIFSRAEVAGPENNST